MSRELDNRRLKDVRPRNWPTMAESYGDPILNGLGFLGEPSVYRARLARARVLELDGKGPLAELERQLAGYGYRGSR